MPSSLRSVLLGLIALLGATSFVPPAAMAQEAGLGGGSDLRAGSIVALPTGASVPAVHHVFADNPEDDAIDVEFRAEAPSGIEITPEQARLRIPPGESVKDPFSITVADAMPPGDHEVTVQLVRTDIQTQPGQLTNIPAVGVTFTIRVVGDSATVTVRAVSAQSGTPVDGTLTLSALTEPTTPFEVARAAGSELVARVAPGDYEAAYLLDGRELAAQRLEATGADTSLTLEVDTVSFVLVAAQPVKEDDKVVVSDLVASVENHLRPIEGPVTIRVIVHRDDGVVETVTLDELNGLPLGITEAELAYRPAEGFSAGTYRFVFELASDDFTLRAADKPTFDVGGSNSLLAVVGIGVGAAAGVAAGWILLRRIRRGVLPSRVPNARR